MKNLKLLSGIIVLLGIDLISKFFFYNIKYLEHTQMITPALNTGISWSLPVPFFIIIGISILGIGAIIRLYKKNTIWIRITGLLLAWTMGNLIDRIIYGGVRDFIDINLFNFPIFNFADIMLCLWVGIRIIKIILEKKK